MRHLSVEISTLLPKGTEKVTYADVVHKQMKDSHQVIRGTNLTTESLSKNRTAQTHKKNFIYRLPVITSE